MISRRKFLASLLHSRPQPANEADWVQALRQVEPPATTVPLSEEEFRHLASVLLSVHTNGLLNLNNRMRRVEWLVPGVDLYVDEEGDV
jgi:hypothetical protein